MVGVWSGCLAALCSSVPPLGLVLGGMVVKLFCVAGGVFCAAAQDYAALLSHRARQLGLLRARSDAACHIKWGQRFFLCISPHVQTDALLRQGPATCRGCFCCMHVLMLHAMSSGASGYLVCISPHAEPDALLRQGPATCRGCYCCMHVLMLHAMSSSGASDILCAFCRMSKRMRCCIVGGRQRAEAASVACTF